MPSPYDKLDAANAAVRAQWKKYDDAVSAGLTGAPLVRINQKLVRLERERDELRDSIVCDHGERIARLEAQR